MIGFSVSLFDPASTRSRSPVSSTLLYNVFFHHVHPVKDSPKHVIFTGQEIVAELSQLGVSHVVWVPDSDLGKWERDLEESPIELVRVCREGEAWPLAAGLFVGGRAPLIMMQTTGLFESGDALRNVLHDMGVPLFAIIGARNWLDKKSRDSARRFATPILDAWSVDYRIIASRADQSHLNEQYMQCRRANKPGAILLAE